MELWRDAWTRDLDPGAGAAAMQQANLSRSAPRVLRGLHVHRRQADLWVVADGHPLVALVDLRPAIAGTGAPVAVTELAAPGEAFYLPAGVAHGFYATDAIALVYLVTNAYDGSDELGFRWDDPDAAIPWTDPDPILSPRDAEAPALGALLARMIAEPAPAATPPVDPEVELRRVMLQLEALQVEHRWVIGNANRARAEVDQARAEADRLRSENQRLQQAADAATARLDGYRVPLAIYGRARAIVPGAVRRPVKSVLSRVLRVR
jgi:dTDP-4-dehydrorhamnose 3,5-epimerase